MSNKSIDFRKKKVTLNTSDAYKAINAKSKNPWDKMTNTKLAELCHLSAQTISIYKNVEITEGMKVLVQLVHMSGLPLDKIITIKDKEKVRIPKNKSNE